jgi:hypothetical protein
MKEVFVSVLIIQIKEQSCFHWCRTLGVAQLVEALRYKPEGRGFDYR